jgi:hypothetical protein
MEIVLGMMETKLPMVLFVVLSTVVTVVMV